MEPCVRLQYYISHAELALEIHPEVLTSTLKVWRTLHPEEYIRTVMVCGSRPNHRQHYLERVFAATILETTMTYFTK